MDLSGSQPLAQVRRTTSEGGQQFFIGVTLQPHMIIVYLSFQIHLFHLINFLAKGFYSKHQSIIKMKEHVDTVACRGVKKNQQDYQK